MNRRECLALLGSASFAAAVWPSRAFSQQAARTLRIAFFRPVDLVPEHVDAFLQGLSEHGYIAGRSLAIEYFVPPTNEDIPAAAAQIIAGKPDAILAVGALAAAAAKHATTTIPIVFAAVSDALGTGLVANLARPGGNLTGTSQLAPDLVGKQITIAKEAIPTLSRIALLNVASSQANVLITAQAAAAARLVGIETAVIDIVQGRDFPPQFDQVVAAGCQAVYVPTSNYFNGVGIRDQLADLQIKHRIPLIWNNGTAQPRSMLGYGPNVSWLHWRSGNMVGAILKGANPADMPVEQPSAYDFLINLTTAKAIGLVIPSALLVQATIVIE